MAFSIEPKKDVMLYNLNLDAVKNASDINGKVNNPQGILLRQIKCSKRNCGVHCRGFGQLFHFGFQLHLPTITKLYTLQLSTVQNERTFQVN